MPLNDEQRTWLESFREGMEAIKINYPGVSELLPEAVWGSFGKALDIIDTLTADLEAEQMSAIGLRALNGGLQMEIEMERAKTKRLSSRLNDAAYRFDLWSSSMVDCNEGIAIEMRAESASIIALLKSTPKPGADHEP